MAAEKDEKKKTKVPTAIKRNLRNEKQRLVNKSFKTRIRGAIKLLEQVSLKGDEATIKTSLNDVYSLLDKGVKRNILKANTAGRLKSRLTAKSRRASA
ncbi:30S ribosomal protein S20 [Chlamydiales bacterium SCGC AB-751-O23]|nr:30S ribosomal protein S20 [Chlamydiales bacterium SCGC AB-751-O23]